MPAHNLPLTLDRIWASVNKNGPTPAHCPEIGPCWVWVRRANEYGYGTIQSHGRVFYVHRIVEALTNGPLPVDIKVLHRCDNPPCCRPTHLFRGTQTDNTRDAALKGRMGQKVTADDVRQIRALCATGKLTLREIGRRYGISKQHTWDIKVRKVWWGVQ